MREEYLKYGTSKKKELANREDETEAVIPPQKNGFLKLMEMKLKGKKCERTLKQSETRTGNDDKIPDKKSNFNVSKSQWYNECEKNTKYFFNLEKRYYKQGTLEQFKINKKHTT